MPCYHPLTAWPSKSGGRVFFKLGPECGQARILLPCGQCIGCRLDRAQEWAIRCYHEASMHDENSFVTMTYDARNLPVGNTLVLEHVQKFFRSLRKRSGRKLRYFVCGEYGEELGRPHYHALVFGYRFPDMVFRKERRGHRVYTSAFLNSVWAKGDCELGAVAFESAGYVARYGLKKINGAKAKKHYEYVDSDGVIHDRLPEFARMSRRPGIGAEWFHKYWRDVFPADEVVMRGRRYPVPAYYDSLLLAKDPEMFERVKADRIAEALERAEEMTPKRCEARETVKVAQVKHLRRQL